MFVFLSRSAASLSLGVAGLRHIAFTASLLMLSAVAADAVVVRGHVTDALGKPVSGARVQLIENGQTEAIGFADAKGLFEIRDAHAGRFTLLGSAQGFMPMVGREFYSGSSDVLEQDVVLSTNSVQQVVSVTATGVPTPLAQLSSAISIIPEETLATRVGVIDELRQVPGVFVVQTGQAGSLSSLFVRGGPSDSNKVLVDGIPVNDVGGVYDFGPMSSTALTAVEVYRGPDSVIYGSDAGASVVNFQTPRGYAEPFATYSGDAGNLHTWRNEVTGGGAWRKLDYYGAFSRFDTSNALAYDQFHAVTGAANLGYQIAPNTSLRGTIRNEVSAEGLPGAHDFLGLSVNGKEKDHDLYTGGKLENTSFSTWHNVVEYGVSRKNETTKYFGNVGILISVFGYPTYFGNVVTIRGANGYKATGQASIFNSADQLVSNRDDLYFQSDKAFSSHLLGLFGFRYENERAELSVPAYLEDHKTQRLNFEYTFQLQGDAYHRFFYSIGGAIEKNHLYGVQSTPRIGLAYVPVRPGAGWLRGTKLRANFATGVHEPSVGDQFSSLYQQLEGTKGGAAAIAAYHVNPIQATRSRTFDIGLDQNIHGDKATFKLGYFHNQFDHQIDYIDSNTLTNDFGIKTGLSTIYGAELNSLAYRAQGIESELELRINPNLFLRGGYTYLDAVVERSFSTDAAYNGTATTNPNLPGTAIGSSYALVGARPFRRPPHTGFVSLHYTKRRLALDLKSSMASRSDDSTFLSYSDVNDDNTLLLPNRDLDYGYVKLDLGGTYAWKHGISYFAQIDNLLNNQHIGPIGYPGLPLTFRIGVKFRLGGE